MTIRKTGNHLILKTGIENYKAFVPLKLPPQNPSLNLELIYPLIDEAMLLSGQLNNIYNTIPDISLFIYYYVRKEALLSSQIEGTQSSLHDLISFENNEKLNISVEDVEEVSNYVKSLNYGIKKLNDGFPLCLRLIKEIHSILLKGIRGQHKIPGEFRTSQNWIGGTRPGNATFVPPPPDKLMEVLGELELFWNDGNVKLPSLVKVALIHVQFETIHPFLDGNGRIGRLLIILFLYKEKVLISPILYISLFLKENRKTYYRLLQEVRTEGTWETWIEFFINGYIRTAKDTIDTIHRMNKIFSKDLTKINNLGRAKESCIKVWNHLKKIPSLTVSKLSKDLVITPPTARSALNHLIKLGIISPKNDKHRDREYIYKKYLNILEKGTGPI